MIGVGTYQIRDEPTIREIVDTALQVGYRFIDTAQCYRNEKAIGNSLKDLLVKHNLKRSDIFITSKLDPQNHKFHVRESVEQSLKDLQTEYIDLFLIHWPGVSNLKTDDPKNKEYRSESWKIMEQLYDEGKLKSLGVSNYNINHMEELLSIARVHPSVNQCEYHPHYALKALVDFCKLKGVHFQAYSSFGSPRAKEDLFSDPKIVELADKYNVSIPKFLLLWSLSQGISVLPRSINSNHVRDNFSGKNMVISEEDIKSATRSPEELRKYCWDPTTVI